MNWKRAVGIVVIAFVLLAVAVGAGLSVYTDSLYRDSYGSSYSYMVTFGANQSLEDLEVMVPVPVEDGSVRIVDSDIAVRDRAETEPADAPPVEASIVQTEHGPMLSITAEAFPIEPRYFQFVEEDGEGQRVEIDESEYDPSRSDMAAFDTRSVRIEVRMESDQPIDTQDPTGTEPLLSPEFGREAVPCEDTHFDTLECYAVESRAFLSYDGPPETRTALWVELEGRNEWWVFGWNGNSYSERYIEEFDGPQDGWRPVAGELETGWGNYR